MIKSNPERDLVEQALTALKPLGLRSRVIEAEGLTDKSRPDAIIEIGRADDNSDGDLTRDMVRYVVEVKRQVTSSNLGPVVHQLRGRDDKPILITSYVSPAIAVQLRDLGVQFIDTAGNASLSNRDFVVWVKGEKPLANKTADGNNDSGRAFQPRGLQVVFTLLCNPEWIDQPFRELAHMSGVANGTVGSVIADLEHQGFVRTLGNNNRGSRRMFNLGDLLRKWTDAYARTLRPRTLLGRYYAPNDAQWKLWDLAGGTQWGGEPAATLLTEHLKPGELTLYAEKTPAQLVARHHLLKSAEPGRTLPVEFRHRFWNFGEEAAAPSGLPPSDAPLRDTVHPYTTALHATVPPLLIYADLIATGDARCLEAANLIHENWLARSLGQ